MQTHASPVLYHFVGWADPANDGENFKILCNILTSMRVLARPVRGRRSGLRLEIDCEASPLDGEPIKQTACCFADIHFDHLPKVHLRKYGRFGVGVDRAVFAEFGGRPVTYIPTIPGRTDVWSSYFSAQLLRAHRSLGVHAETKDMKTTVRGGDWMPSSLFEAADFARTRIGLDVLPYLKEFDATLPDEDPKNYYMEKEWRKLTGLDLEMLLKEVIVPREYQQEFCRRFSEKAALLRLI